ncbi:hypothetical protein LXA43DRAFT_991167 [Ganoderma leucocontextum]|nr:hypothetical protein LXA43DRAFT_991167 [Ganoderma leucocontextum]
MLTTMAAGATLAATASQLANATDYVQQLQGLLRATEAALDTANTLNATGGRWLKLVKPILTARDHYKDALDIYSLAMEMIKPCIGDMKQQDALEFLESATLFLDFRKIIYEDNSYKRQECIKLRRRAIILKETADRSRAKTNVDQLHSIVMNRPTTTRDPSRGGSVSPPAMYTCVAAPHDAVVHEPANRNPFMDPRYTTPPRANPDVSGPSVQAST